MIADQALINPPYTVESVMSVTAALNGNSEDNGRSALLARVKHVVWPFQKLIVVATGTNQVGVEFGAKGTRRRG